MFKRPSFKNSSSVTERDRCDVTANPEETMESFTTESKKALWHVYDMLKSANSTDVHISQLKVRFVFFVIFFTIIRNTS